MKKYTLSQIRDLAIAAKPAIWEKANRVERDVKIYLHWTAGHYGQFFDDYHINIDKDGEYYLSTENLAATLAHTWRRNTGAIGIALACAVGATREDLGKEPPTQAQVEAMARVIAVLADVLDLTVDIQRIMTHAEAAENMDGWEAHDPYGVYSTFERWDLAILTNEDNFMSGGDTLRGKAAWYQRTYGKELCEKFN